MPPAALRQKLSELHSLMLPLAVAVLTLAAIAGLIDPTLYCFSAFAGAFDGP